MLSKYKYLTSLINVCFLKVNFPAQTLNSLTVTQTLAVYPKRFRLWTLYRRCQRLLCYSQTSCCVDENHRCQGTRPSTPSHSLLIRPPSDDFCFQISVPVGVLCNPSASVVLCHENAARDAMVLDQDTRYKIFGPHMGHIQTRHIMARTKHNQGKNSK